LKKIFLIIALFLTLLDAKELKLSKLDEIRILSSLDIDASYMNDAKYIKMKNNIDELKVIYFLRTLKKGDIFMPNLHELLGESQIPDTFLYMAMIESRFLADVKSHKNAAGLWQIMPLTAKKFSLKINHSVDERLDPIKSTKVAIKYLNYLHERFGKWYLAAIAYNCGETKLARVIRKIGTDDLSVLVDDNNKHLPQETRDYIRRIVIAALLAYDDEIIIKNNANHLFGNCTNSKLVEVFFSGGMSLDTISKKVGISLKKIKTCNPHLLNSKLPSYKKKYHVYLPEEYLDNLRDGNQRISVGRFTYTIKSGDTLSLISKKFNIRIEAIKNLNPNLKEILRIGENIILMGDSTPELQSPKVEKKQKIQIVQNEPKSGEIFTYFVQKDDTPYSISLKFNNTLSTLTELNPNFPKIKEGMAIKVKH